MSGAAISCSVPVRPLLFRQVFRACALFADSCIPPPPFTGIYRAYFGGGCCQRPTSTPMARACYGVSLTSWKEEDLGVGRPKSSRSVSVLRFVGTMTGTCCRSSHRDFPVACGSRGRRRGPRSLGLEIFLRHPLTILTWKRPQYEPEARTVRRCTRTPGRGDAGNRLPAARRSRDVRPKAGGDHQASDAGKRKPPKQKALRGRGIRKRPNASVYVAYSAGASATASDGGSTET